MGTTAADLLDDLSRLGIELEACGGRLKYRPRSALTPDLAERLRDHKAEILALLQPAAVPGEAAPAAAGSASAARRPEATPASRDPELAGNRPEETPEPIWGEDLIDPPDPCPKCSGLLFGWNAFEDRRCMTCDPPTTAIRALEHAERISRKHGIPSPPGRAEMLADLKRLTGT